MTTLFDNYAPTASYSEMLHVMANACCDAEALIALAERVTDTYDRYVEEMGAQGVTLSPWIESMEVDNEGDNAGNAMPETLGPYRAENTVHVWQALVWMALSREQWSKIVEYWKGSGFLNPNAMRGMWMDCGDQQHDVPVAMISAVGKGASTVYEHELVMLEEPCCDRVHLQVGAGMISVDAVQQYDAMMEERRAYEQEHGWVVAFKPRYLAFIYGVAYVQDQIQWSNGELQEIDELSRRQAKQRIYVQTFDNKHGYYVPLGVN